MEKNTTHTVWHYHTHHGITKREMEERITAYESYLEDQLEMEERYRSAVGMEEAIQCIERFGTRIFEGLYDDEEVVPGEREKKNSVKKGDRETMEKTNIFVTAETSWSYFEGHCETCDTKINEGQWIVRSCGPNEYWFFPLLECPCCWNESTRGDGHCYAGVYSTKQEAMEVAESLSS